MRNAIKAACLMCLTLLVCGIANAQGDPFADKVAQLQNDLTQTQAAQAALAPIGKAMHAEAEQITFGQEASHKATEAYVAEKQQYESSKAAYDAVPTCHYPQGRPEQCAAWQQSMDSRWDALESTRKDMNVKQDQLKALDQAVLDRITKWHQTYDGAIQQHKLNAEKIAKLQAELNAIRNGNDACKQAILHGGEETMHAVCGAMFDGNDPNNP